MIKKFVAAAAVVIGLVGYAGAQEAAPTAAPAPSSAQHHHHSRHHHHSHHHKQTPKPVKLCEGCGL